MLQSNSAANSGPQEQSALNTIQRRLINLLDALAGNSSRLSLMRDRALGENSKGINSSAPKAVPNGLIGAIQELLDTAESVSQDQMNHITSLETIL